MNNISQISIFYYTEIENLGDLEKLKLFLENVEDDDIKISFIIDFKIYYKNSWILRLFLKFMNF